MENLSRLSDNEILERERLLTAEAPHNPLSGLGCTASGPRRAVTRPGGDTVFVPARMVEACGGRMPATPVEFDRLRAAHDFEFWAARCITIRDKRTGRPMPFVLNAPQRKLLAVMEEQRLAGRPVRVILLKARQWGGSTLVQMYMAWIQLVLRRNWNSYICAHVKDAACTIRGMYQEAIAGYPPELFDGDESTRAPAFKGFGRSENIRELAGRGCRVTVGSCVSQEASRGADVAMAHLSEVAYWGEARKHDPADLVRAIVSGIALEPLTLVVMESTANGVGDFFHREWLRAQQGRSDKAPVFVAWHEIAAYRLQLADDELLEVAHSLSAYEQGLWQAGAPLCAIAWHRLKRLEYAGMEKMKAEYPSDPVEAFANTGAGVFAVSAVERLRAGCRAPEVRVIGPWQWDEWEPPRSEAEYVVGVDVGGRSDSADWSVAVAVRCDGRQPAVVAQWRGHDDHDLLARRAAALAEHYNGALLVVESNTLESTARGDSSAVIDTLRLHSSNLYMRRGAEGESRFGFHTNVSTKARIISHLYGLVRDGAYTERCAGACDELCTYERLPSGAYAARAGCHDDMLMARAIALYVAHDEGLGRRFPAFKNGSW